jgi:hypothetical protein
VTAIICGTVLAWRPVASPDYSNLHAKPMNNDADAYDVVSCRG